MRFEYPILVIIAALGMGMMVSAGDLIALYVSIELQSLALYILAAFQNNVTPGAVVDGKSSEAGLKYFVLGALSSGILLYGASLVYGFAGSTRFSDIAVAMSHGAGGGALFGLVFLICGIGFKVSAAPFHMWTPDVYEGAPTPVVGFFAGAPKLAAMVLLARLLSESFGGAVLQWRQVLVAMAVISVAVGAFAGLAQNDLKRLWAYSSIASIGYALVGLAAGGAAGIQSMLVFMVLYTVDVTGFFACLAALTRGGKPMQSLDDFAGLARERPAPRRRHDLLRPVRARPAAVQQLLGQGLCVQGLGRRRARADRRHRPGRQRRRRLLLPQADPPDVVRHRDGADRHAGAHGQPDRLRLRRLRLPGRAGRPDLARPRRYPGGAGAGAALILLPPATPR